MSDQTLRAISGSIVGVAVRTAAAVTVDNGTCVKRLCRALLNAPAKWGCSSDVLVTVCRVVAVAAAGMFCERVSGWFLGMVCEREGKEEGVPRERPR